MPTYIAFLRAVNVGQRKYPMAELRDLLGGAGYDDVQTHIQTGNVLLTTPERSRAKVTSALEELFAEDRGFDVTTVLFTPPEVVAIAEEAERVAGGKPPEFAHYVSLLAAKPSQAKASQMEELAREKERVVVSGRAVHLLYDLPYHEAKTSNAAVEKVLAAKADRRALSVGLVGNCATVLPELLRRGVAVDVVTDQTSAHDPLAYLPEGVSVGEWHEYAAAKPEEFTDRARASMAKHVEAMVGFMDAGAEVFDYGNSIRGEAKLAGYQRAFDFPGFVPAYIRPLFCEGKGPFRWAALSGDPRDIEVTDRAVLELFPDNEPLARWIHAAREKVAYQGLPARICWLGYGERSLAGVRFNELVASGEISAPVVIGRDHLDCGSVASPYRETEAMADGSDAIADWPLLNALVNTASGASWVSIHHGGGVGIGRSIHAGQVCVADGSAVAGEKLDRVLTNDPATGLIRHVDAGYQQAVDVAQHAGVRIPMRESASS